MTRVPSQNTKVGDRVFACIDAAHPSLNARLSIMYEVVQVFSDGVVIAADLGAFSPPPCWIRSWVRVR